jgi:hypothetical protein
VEPGVFVAMMLGAIPALVLMFYMLGPFEGIFDERSTFFSFIIGMVVGVVVGVLHVMVDGWAVPYWLTALGIFVVGFAIFDQFMRVAIFNSSRFAGKTETTFYATSFGLGYGAMLVALWFFRTFADPSITINAWVVIGYLAASFAFAVIHGTTGMMVGFGATEGEVWRFGALGVGLEMGLNFLWYIALASSIYSPAAPVWELGVIVMGIAALYGYFVLRWAMRKIIPDLLPTEAMRARRRLLRRRQRTGAQR